jgi:hypothetical protein
MTASGANLVSGFDEPQRVLWMRVFLNLPGAAFYVAEIFWG